MIDPALYNPDDHHQTQLSLRRLLWNLHGELEDKQTRSACVPLNQLELLDRLSQLANAYVDAIDATPEATLDRLKARATKRLLASCLIVLNWGAALAALLFGVAAALQHDGRMVVAWSALLLATLVANHLLAQVPRCTDAEREQLRILSAWTIERACTICHHGPHMPGACPWGVTNAGKGCNCGELDEDQSRT